MLDLYICRPGIKAERRRGFQLRRTTEAREVIAPARTHGIVLGAPTRTHDIDGMTHKRPPFQNSKRNEEKVASEVPIFIFGVYPGCDLTCFEI
jgi:hypothetical protein